MLAELLLSFLLLLQCHAFPSSNSTADRISIAVSNAKCDNIITPPYVEEEAKSFLDLAAASYNSPAQENARQKCFDKAFSSYKFLTVASMKTPCDKLNHECQAFIARSDVQKTFVISFRGTEGLGQLITEAVDSLLTYEAYSEVVSNEVVEYGSVNKYFYEAMKTLWSEMILPNIQNYPDHTYFITGHSLGGALAAMTAFRLSVQGYTDKNKIHMISFGEPRVGDFTYAEHYPCQVPYSFRIVHDADPIPHLPPLSIIKRQVGKPYHHTREIWYSKKFNSYTACSDTDGEDKACSDKESFYNYAGAGSSVHLHYFNHFISQYGLDGCSATSPLSITMSFLLAIVCALFF